MLEISILWSHLSLAKFKYRLPVGKDLGRTSCLCWFMTGDPMIHDASTLITSEGVTQSTDT